MEKMKEAETQNLISDRIEVMTLPEVREYFISGFVFPNVETIPELDVIRGLRNRLSGRVVRGLFDEVLETQTRFSSRKGKRWEVTEYMVDQKAKELFSRVGNVLVDLSKLRDTIVLPETEDELACLVPLIGKSLKTGEPITFVTPVCPDWSKDSEGHYDFKSLGGGESFIANKFFVNSPEFLEVFHRHQVPFRGVILFADWGLETEIDANDTFGQKLSPEDIQICFASTFAATDRTLKVLQDDENFGPLFANFEVASMKKFLASTIDEQKVMSEMREFFTTDKQGSKLLEVLNRDSIELNRQRLGIEDEDANRELMLRNLVEYSTVGHSVGDNGILVVCESRTTSRCYNLPRERGKKVPVFFVKGKERLEGGVNIL